MGSCLFHVLVDMINIIEHNKHIYWRISLGEVVWGEVVSGSGLGEWSGGVVWGSGLRE